MLLPGGQDIPREYVERPDEAGFCSAVLRLLYQCLTLETKTVVMAPDPHFFRFIRSQRRRLGGGGCAEFFRMLLRAACPGAEAALDQGPGAEKCFAAQNDLPEGISEALGTDPLLVGWAYQLWNEPERKASTWGVSRRGERQPERLKLSAATQIFTDEQMGAFLCERAAFLKKLDASLCDPACGVGHLLVQALRSVRAHRPSAPIEKLLESLFGFDIDPFAVQLCRGVLAAEAVRLGAPDVRRALAIVRERITTVDGPLGTLDRAAEQPLLRRTYGCILMNPPYLGRRKLTAEARVFLDREYPDSSLDLCSAFVERALELLAPEGFLGLVTHDKWLRLKGYRKLRNGGRTFGGIYNELTVDALCELGKRAFDRQLGLHDGLGVVLLSARKGRPHSSHELLFITLSAVADSEEKSARLRALPSLLNGGAAEGRLLCQKRFMLEPHDRIFLEGSDIPAALQGSSRRLESDASVIVGLQTNDDRRFVRNHWEVIPDASRWRVHSKGGGYGRWYGLNRTVLDWGEGRRIFERSARAGLSAEPWFEKSGWVYSWFANGSLGLRSKEPGWSFGRAASSGLFCDDERLVGFLNSRYGSLCARSLGGKVQLPEGVVRRLPLPETLDGIEASLVRAAVDLKRELVRCELLEVTFDPDRGVDAIERIVVEAVLRIVEAQLELQVSQAMGLRLEPSTVTEVGPVGLLPLPEEISLDEFWSLVPERFRGLRAALAGALRCARVRRTEQDAAGDERLISALVGKPLPIGCRLTLPADGWLERLCAALRLNPIEVAVRSAKLSLCNTEVQRALDQPLAEQQLFVSVLRLLGHRFWRGPPGSSLGRPASLPLQGVASLVEGTPQAARLARSVGISAEGWLVRRLEGWQRATFGSAGPVSISRGTRVALTSVQRAAAAMHSAGHHGDTPATAGAHLR